MDREELKFLCQSDPDRFVDLFLALQKQVEVLTKRVSELEAIIGKNSKNSSKPPSSDGFNKPKHTQSLRKKSKKKPGGQLGHKGARLEKVDKPDHIELHTIDQCDSCGYDLKNNKPSDVEKRQVFDIPPINFEVTEHQGEIKACPCCGKENRATFPEYISQSVQYGPRFSALIVYLKEAQYIPYKRLRQFIGDLTGHFISEGTIYNFTKRCSKNLQSFYLDLKETILDLDFFHADETGMRSNGKLSWLHSISTNAFTFLALHKNRGQKAMNDIGILPFFKGIVSHDFWSSYFRFGFKHAICNAHLLRELVFEHTVKNQKWAEKMIKLLCEIKKRVDSNGGSVSKTIAGNYNKKYFSIILGGLKHTSKPEKIRGKRGRIKKSTTRNLLERFKNYSEDILRFMIDVRVPFDNNQAERDIRMAKLKEKISGCFRSAEGGEMFSVIQSYISTMKKAKQDILNALQLAMIGKAKRVNLAE